MKSAPVTFWTVRVREGDFELHEREDGTAVIRVLPGSGHRGAIPPGVRLRLRGSLDRFASWDGGAGPLAPLSEEERRALRAMGYLESAEDTSAARCPG